MTDAKPSPRYVLTLLAAVAMLLAASDLHAGRYESMTEWAATGPKMQVQAATYFGAAGIEEFVAAGQLKDGTIVAFGNTWGPQFATSPRPTVLGRDNHRGHNPVTKDRKGRESFSRANPDVAGMFVFYSADLQKVARIVRLGYGIASFETGAVAPDGGLVVSGHCTDAIQGLATGGSVPVQRHKATGKATGPYKWNGVDVSGDCFVAKFSADGSRIQWLCLLEGYRTSPAQIWFDDKGNTYFEAHGMTRVDPNGAAMTKITEKGSGGKVGVRSVDPETGTYYFGGDRNTRTGREPWRQPFLYCMSPEGQKQWTLWEWNSRLVGTDKYRLVSDSAIRVGTIDRNGDLLFGGWSDGGNSVFTRNSLDLDKPAPKQANGFTCWGMRNANSLGWIMRVDPKTRQVKSWCNFVCYIPQDFAVPKYRGAPNGLHMDQMEVLADGSLAVCGGAATGLIQTPNAFYDHPHDGRKYGGEYVAVFAPDLAHMHFSSYLPGYETASIAPTKAGLVVVGRTKGDDGRENPAHASPAVKAVQPKLQGKRDGHIILLSLPADRT